MVFEVASNAVARPEKVEAMAAAEEVRISINDSGIIKNDMQFYREWTAWAKGKDANKKFAKVYNRKAVIESVRSQ